MEGDFDRASLAEPDSSKIEPIEHIQNLRIKYVKDKFYLLKNFGSLLQIYKGDQLLEEITVSKIQKAGNTYVMAAVGVTVDFFHLDEELVFFQHSPNQIKRYDMSSKKFTEEKQVKLPFRGNITQAVFREGGKYLLLVVDPQNPNILQACQYDLDKESASSIWEETLTHPVKDGLLGFYGQKLAFLGAGESSILLYDLDSHQSSIQNIPETNEREYQYNPEFESDNPFDWVELSREEKSRFRTDRYQSFLFKDAEFFACHYIYQRDSFDSKMENHFYTKNKIDDPIVEYGYLKNIHHFEFNSPDYFVALIREGESHKLIADWAENIEEYLR